ncbi:MAG: CGNR zinc finger domain-containing protein [Rhizobiaceae bacterium]
MAISWNAHRFAGGVLALSAANTVVNRNDPERREDRFALPGEMARFGVAAAVHCREELAGEAVDPGDPGLVIAVREAVDDLFRDHAERGEPDPARLAQFLRIAADAIETETASGLGLAAAMALSGLSLLRPERLARIRACPNCDWLFFDRSRNGSRIWCDMAVCGNRAKARRHHRRRTKGVSGHG